MSNCFGCVRTRYLSNGEGIAKKENGSRQVSFLNTQTGKFYKGITIWFLNCSERLLASIWLHCLVWIVLEAWTFFVLIQWLQKTFLTVHANMENEIKITTLILHVILQL